MDVFYFYTCVTAVKDTVSNENMSENKSNEKKEYNLEMNTVIEYNIYITIFINSTYS